MPWLAGGLLLAALLTSGPVGSQPTPEQRLLSPKKKLAPTAPGDDRTVQASPPAAQQVVVVPPPEVLLVMLRTTLLALDHANKTNNYAVLRALGGPELRKFSPEQLSQVFADLRNRGIDLSPVAVVTPQVLEAPQITPEGVLLLIGYFPTRPLQIQFQVAFQSVGGQWRIFGLTVKASP